MGYFGFNNVEGVAESLMEVKMSLVEVDVNGWGWVEMDGAGWRWAHGLALPVWFVIK